MSSSRRLRRMWPIDTTMIRLKVEAHQNRVETAKTERVIKGQRHEKDAQGDARIQHRSDICRHLFRAISDRLMWVQLAPVDAPGGHEGHEEICERQHDRSLSCITGHAEREVVEIEIEHDRAEEEGARREQQSGRSEIDETAWSQLRLCGSWTRSLFSLT